MAVITSEDEFNYEAESLADKLNRIAAQAYRDGFSEKSAKTICLIVLDNWIDQWNGSIDEKRLAFLVICQKLEQLWEGNHARD